MKNKGLRILYSHNLRAGATQYCGPQSTKGIGCCFTCVGAPARVSPEVPVFQVNALSVLTSRTRNKQLSIGQLVERRAPLRPSFRNMSVVRF